MQTRALELAHELQRQAQDLVDALEELSYRPDHVRIIEAHNRARNSIRGLEQIFVQPGDFLLQLGVSQQLLMCIHWLCHFNIVSAVPIGSGQGSTYTELARTTDVPLTTMKSVIKMAMVFGFFQELPNGTLQHTALSSSFAMDSNLCNWMMYMATETAPTVAHFVRATESWPGSEKRNETAYSLSRGTKLSFFDHINLVPERAKEFGRYMESQAVNNRGTSVDQLAEGLDWASLGRAVVVDVGGGGGDASISLAEKFSLLHFVVQDLPTAIAMAKQRAKLLPNSVSDRIRFQEHNFFDPQPVKGGCSLPDKDDLTRLARQRMRQDPEAAIGIDGGTMALDQEAVLRQKDLVMKQNFNAKERDLEEWEALMASAGLRILSVRSPEGSHLSVLEVLAG